MRCSRNRQAHSDLVILDELGYLPFSASGGALPFHLLSTLYERTSVVITTNLSFSEWATVLVMAVNNEIGTVQPIAPIRDCTFRVGAFFHTDATQAPAAMPISVAEWGVDAASFSGHKIYGPKGIGALFLSGSAPWRPVPLLHGGGQESGLRPGTIATPLCVGLAEAFRLMAFEGVLERKAVEQLRNRLADRFSGSTASRLLTCSMALQDESMRDLALLADAAIACSWRHGGNTA